MHQNRGSAVHMLYAHLELCEFLPHLKSTELDVNQALCTWLRGCPPDNYKTGGVLVCEVKVSKTSTQKPVYAMNIHPFFFTCTHTIIKTHALLILSLIGIGAAHTHIVNSVWCRPPDQPRDAARREECSDLDEKSLTTFVVVMGGRKGLLESTKMDFMRLRMNYSVRIAVWLRDLATAKTSKGFKSAIGFHG